MRESITERLRSFEMNSIGTSSVAFVALSALFWSGWVIGSQSQEGQEVMSEAERSRYQDLQRQRVALRAATLAEL